MSKFLVKLFMLNTRLIVTTYTITTLPLYYMIQKPWKTLEVLKKMRTKKFTTINGEVVWSRNDTPITHSVLQYKSYAEILKNLKNDYDLNRPVMAQRDVIEEHIEKDAKGDIVRVDGKILRKVVLSDSYKWLTLNEVIQRVDNISKGLTNSGVKRGDNVIIWADTRMEWTLCSLALVKVNTILTTLLSNLEISGVIYAMNQTKAKTIITSIDLLSKLKPFIKEVPTIELIIYIKNTKNDVLSHTFPQNISVKSLEELESLGLENRNNFEFKLPNDLNETALIMYTSGTTGTPKAVTISHKQLMASIKTYLSNSTNLTEETDSYLYMSYLPLAHIMGFTFEMFLFFSGVRIGYSSPLTITSASPGLSKGQVGDANLLEPTMMPAVPLVLERILKEIYNRFNARTPVSAPLFTYLMEYKIRWKSRGFDTPIVNKLFCEEISKVIGGHLQYILVGGAPLNPRTQALIKAALNVKQISQGYGATETCGGVVGMHMDDPTYGRIGIPMEGVNLKLVDWPEGGYLSSDKPNPRGELVIGSDCVAQGYYQLPEVTDESFVRDADGNRWFYSGDIAEVYSDGSFSLIDRKKDLIKLSNGEYISFGKIESALKSCKLVENICVVVNSNRTLLSCLVTPNHKSLLSLAKQLAKPETNTREQLCSDPDIIAKVYESVVESARINNLTKIETPNTIKLCAEEWTSDNNLITAAFKLKRKNVLSYYKNDLNNLFK